MSLSRILPWKLPWWASRACMISCRHKLTFSMRMLNPVSSLWLLVLYLPSVFMACFWFPRRYLPHFNIVCSCGFPGFIQMAHNFDECRRKWLRTEQDLGSCKEVLTKTETERGALEVKLKHARNQVDVEIRRRQKAEAECEKLVRGINCWPLFVGGVEFACCYFT